MATTSAPGSVGWFNNFAAQNAKRITAIKPMSFNYMAESYIGNSDFNDRISRLKAYDAANAFSSNVGVFDPTAGYVSETYSSSAWKPESSINEPSADVKSAMKKNQTAWDQAIALGKTGISKAGNLIGWIGDQIGRLEYANNGMRNIYVDKALTNESAGGKSVTLGEHISSAAKPWFHMFTFGAFADDDLRKAAYEGITLKKKVDQDTILRKEYVNYDKWNGWQRFGAQLGASVLSDPLSYVTIGTGSIAKGVTAGGAKLIGKADFADSLLKRTVLTTTGRQAGREELIMGMRGTKLKKAKKRLNRDVDRGKITKANADTAFEQVKTQVSKDLADDLKGLRLAAKALRHKPFTAYGLYTQGVRKGNVLEAERFVSTLHLRSIEEAKKKLVASNPVLIDYHDKMKGQTFTYTIPGVKAEPRKFTIADDFDQFLDEFTHKFMPRLEITEKTRLDLRARRGKLIALNADSTQFILGFIRHFENDYGKHFGSTTRPTPPTPPGAAPVGPLTSPTPPGGGGGGVGPSAPTPTPSAPTVSRSTPGGPTIHIDPGSAAQTQAAQDADVDRLLTDLQQTADLTDAERATVRSAATPDQVTMDQVMGNNDRTASMRDSVLAAATSKIDEAIEQHTLDLASELAKEGPTYIRGANAALASAISDAYVHVIKATHAEMDAADATLMITGIMDHAAKAINQLVAHAKHQVLVGLSERFGKDLPSFAPLKSMFDDKDFYQTFAQALGSPDYADAIERDFNGTLLDWLVSGDSTYGRAPAPNREFLNREGLLAGGRADAIYGDLGVHEASYTVGNAVSEELLLKDVPELNFEGLNRQTVEGKSKIDKRLDDWVKSLNDPEIRGAELIYSMEPVHYPTHREWIRAGSPKKEQPVKVKINRVKREDKVRNLAEVGPDGRLVHAGTGALSDDVINLFDPVSEPELYEAVARLSNHKELANKRQTEADRANGALAEDRINTTSMLDYFLHVAPRSAGRFPERQIRYKDNNPVNPFTHIGNLALRGLDDYNVSTVNAIQVLRDKGWNDPRVRLAVAHLVDSDIAGLYVDGKVGPQFLQAAKSLGTHLALPTSALSPRAGGASAIWRNKLFDHIWQREELHYKLFEAINYGILDHMFSGSKYDVMRIAQEIDLLTADPAIADILTGANKLHNDAAAYTDRARRAMAERYIEPRLGPARPQTAAQEGQYTTPDIVANRANTDYASKVSTQINLDMSKLTDEEFKQIYGIDKVGQGSYKAAKDLASGNNLTAEQKLQDEIFDPNIEPDTAVIAKSTRSETAESIPSLEGRYHRTEVYKDGVLRGYLYERSGEAKTQYFVDIFTGERHEIAQPDRALGRYRSNEDVERSPASLIHAEILTVRRNTNRKKVELWLDTVRTDRQVQAAAIRLARKKGFTPQHQSWQKNLDLYVKDIEEARRYYQKWLDDSTPVAGGNTKKLTKILEGPIDLNDPVFKTKVVQLARKMATQQHAIDNTVDIQKRTESITQGLLENAAELITKAEKRKDKYDNFKKAQKEAADKVQKADATAARRYDEGGQTAAENILQNARAQRLAVERNLASRGRTRQREVNARRAQQAEGRAPAADTRAEEAVRSARARREAQEEAQAPTPEQAASEAPSLPTPAPEVEENPIITRARGNQQPYPAETRVTIDGLYNATVKNSQIQSKVANGLQQASASLQADMFAYRQKMEDELNQVKLGMGATFNVAGIPIAPLAYGGDVTQSFAGAIALNERRGRIANWVTQTLEERPKIADTMRKFRKPSSFLDATLNEMRKSSSNLAYGTLISIHSEIDNTWGAISGRAARHKLTRDFFTKGLPVSNELDEVEKRLMGISSFITMGIDVSTRRGAAIALERALAFNTLLPKKWRIPEEAIKANVSEDIFTREWFIRISDWTRGHNLEKNAYAGNRIFDVSLPHLEYAMQHARAKLVAREDTVSSMLSNFAVRVTNQPTLERIEAMNQTLPEGMRYIPVKDNVINSRHIPTKYIDGLGRYPKADYYVREDYAKDMSILMDYMTGTDVLDAKLLNNNLLKAVHNYWKGMVTTFNIPKFHIANSLSDVFLGALDGVISPKHYKRGFTVIRNAHPSSKNISKNPDLYASIMEKDKSVDIGESSRFDQIGNRSASQVAPIPVRPEGGASPDITTIHTSGGVVTLNCDVLQNAYTSRGVGQTQITNVVMQGADAYRTSRPQKAAAGVLDKINDWSNMREDGFRMAHFIHAIEDEAAKGVYTLDEVFDRAAARVIKYHFDYTDVSNFEKVVVGQAMPFYKWIRNIIPLSVSLFFTNPKAYTIPDAINTSMANTLMPPQYDEEGNRIPVDAVVPSYIAQNTFLPISIYTDTNGNEMARYAALNLPLTQTVNNWIAPLINPFMDPETPTAESFKQSAAGGIKSLLGGINPYAKIVFGTAYGSTFGPGGSEFKTDNPLMDFGKQMIPFWSHAQTTDKLLKRGVDPNSPVSLLKDYLGFLSGADNTEGGQLAELANENRRITGIKKNAENEWTAKYYPDDPGQAKEFLRQRGFDARD